MDYNFFDDDGLFDGYYNNIPMQDDTADDRKITLMVHTKFRTEKPQKEDFAYMSKQYSEMRLSFGQLEYYIIHGCSFRPGILQEGESTGKYFVGQQCFFVDVDNENQVVQSSLDICQDYGIIPNIIYPTFHYEADHQRHRLVFIAPNIITDAEMRDLIQIKLIEIFHADQNAKDRARQFCGGLILFWADERGRLDVKQLLKSDMKQGGERRAA